MQKGPIALSCGLILLLCAAFQDPGPQIRVEVEAVSLLVTVTDERGRFVTDLREDQFEIRDEGVVQEITNFSHQTDLPLRIALLIDTSSSVRLKLDFEKQTATKFIHSLMRPRDQALLVEFDSGVSLLHDFTRRPDDIAREIRNLRAGGGTALIDALYTVSRDKMAERETRQTMVVVSDGRDLNSRRTVEEALEMVHRSRVTIYAVGLHGRKSLLPLFS
jgi:Ca-activated chloride channel homolog